MYKVSNYLSFLLSGLIVVGTITFTGCNEDDDIDEPTPMDIVDFIQTSPELSTLSSAIQVGGLIMLKGEGPYTVFAPNNDAFENLPSGVLSALYNDPDKLTDLLLYHTLMGDISSSDLSTGTIAPLYKRDGHIDFEVTGQSITLNGSASVIGPDNEVVNGVVHIIDEVIVPVDFQFPN